MNRKMLGKRGPRRPTRRAQKRRSILPFRLGIGRVIATVFPMLFSAGAATPSLAHDLPRRAEFDHAGLQTDVAWPDVSSALADGLVLRVLSPLPVEAVRRQLASRTVALVSSLNLTRERFTIYVPSARPAAGFAVLVFIPPWETAQLPSGWASALNRHGVIFITPAGAGNDEPVLTRRMPLAMAALETVTRNYSVDRTRIYVGGFSGGSRVALRLALAYPDLIHGAILNAGSDPIASPPLSLPDPDRMAEFRTGRLVFVTGAADDVHMAMDNATTSSLRHWCATNFVVTNAPFAGHEVAAAAQFDRALVELSKLSSNDKLEQSCIEARQSEVAAAKQRVEAALGSEDRVSARRLILDIDRTYGGLAGPDLVALADRCGCGLFGSRKRPGSGDEKK